MTPLSPEELSFQITDYLVLGSGVAGLRAAITLGQHGRVLIVNKGVPKQSASESAQGGIAVALDPQDSVEAHLADTLQAGKGLCRREAVEVLVGDGPKRVQELIQWGARFDQKEGRYLFATEAGHRTARILRAQGDASGTEIVRALLSKARNLPTLTWLDHHFTADLLIQDGRCIGAVLLSAHNRFVVVGAKAVVLATGGAGQVYARTTNPPVATADGMAMAYRAGVVLEDMEFVQFHPTALALPGAPAFLLTEAMRGEGAILRNVHGEAFMKRYDPAGELATRDIVSRAIWQEMRSTQASHVYLDITHFDAVFIRQRFPTITRTCLRYGLDITQKPIPVSPSAHFMIGGVKTSPDGATTLPGLYAAGEVACNGVHGANRLASNSLLEGLVFGAQAAEAIVASSPPNPPDLPGLQTIFRRRLSEDKAQGSTALGPIATRLENLKQMMWRTAGIVRDGKSLTEALQRLESWGKTRISPVSSQQEGEFNNLLTVALLIVRAALLRKHSIGVHYRSDDPSPGKADDLRHIAFRHPDHPEGYLM